LQICYCSFLVFIDVDLVLLPNGLMLHTAQFKDIIDKAKKNSVDFNLREDMLFFIVFSY